MEDLTTVDDVQTFFINITFSDLTNPTKLTVERWITEATSIIASTLSSAYTLPITDSSDLILLKGICEDYVLENINYTLGRNRLAVDANGMQMSKTIKHTSFNDKLKTILNGDVKLNSTVSAYFGSYSMYIEDSTVAPESDKQSVAW